MLEGGTGAPDYVPVTTKIAFHIEVVDGVVTGAFEFLAAAPSSVKGPGSANFTENVMYVTGSVDTARVEGDSIRFSGNSCCTGIGAGRACLTRWSFRREDPELRSGCGPEAQGRSSKRFFLKATLRFQEVK